MDSKKLISTALLTAACIGGATTPASAQFCPWVWEPVCTEEGERSSNGCFAEAAGQTTRTGGALIHFNIVGEELWVFSTNDAFIDEAIETFDSGATPRVPSFVPQHGADCSEPYVFHLDAADMHWADFTIEVCDGRPSDLQSDPSYWVDTVGAYCPWTSEIVGVYDYR